MEIEMNYRKEKDEEERRVKATPVEHSLREIRQIRSDSSRTVGAAV